MSGSARGRRGWLLVVAALVAAACEDRPRPGAADADGGLDGGREIRGVAQKGPFAPGTWVALRPLGPDLAPAGPTLVTQTTDVAGSFRFTADFAAGPVEVATSGYAFDEILGGLAARPTALYALADVAASGRANLNVLTTLERPRVLALVAAGLTFAAAKARAQADVLAAFGVRLDGIGPSEALDITGTGGGDAALLALSALLTCLAWDDPDPAPPLPELLAALATDLADGVLDDAALGPRLSLCQRFLDRDLVRRNLTTWLAAQGATVTLPPFEGFLDSDGDGALDRDDPYARGTLTLVPVRRPLSSWAAVVLSDGRVLITSYYYPAPFALIFDPATLSFTETGPPGDCFATLTLLADGRVLAFNSGYSCAGLRSGSQVWDPASGTFTSTGDAAGGHDHPTSTLLPDGRVLVVGGTYAEIWDPQADHFTMVVPLAQERGRHAAAPLPDGRVLLVGGGSQVAELFDPTIDQSIPVADLGETCAPCVAARLPDGRVLVAGTSIHVYDPTTYTFTAGEALFGPLYDGAALADKSVLLVTDPPPHVGFGTGWMRCDPDTGLLSLGPAGQPRPDERWPAILALPDGRAFVLSPPQSFYLYAP